MTSVTTSSFHDTDRWRDSCDNDNEEEGLVSRLVMAEVGDGDLPALLLLLQILLLDVVGELDVATFFLFGDFPLRIHLLWEAVTAGADDTSPSTSSSLDSLSPLSGLSGCVQFILMFMSISMRLLCC